MDEVFEYLHSYNRKDLDIFFGKKWKWKLERRNIMTIKKETEKDVKKTYNKQVKKDLIKLFCA